MVSILAPLPTSGLPARVLGESSRTPTSDGAADLTAEPTLEPLIRAYAARVGDAGALCDPQTGALDPRRVLAHVQRAANLPETGTLDARTLLALLLLARREAPSPSAAPAFSPAPAPSGSIPPHRFANTGAERAPRFRAAQATPSGGTTTAGVPGSGLAVPHVAPGNGLTSGQASAAAAISFVTGKPIEFVAEDGRRLEHDLAFDERYGLNLLGGLNAETRAAGVTWRDTGNLGPRNADAMRTKIQGALAQGLPVLIGLNGPEFAASGRGHIVTITGLSPDGTVTFMDPSGGCTRTTRWEKMVGAPSHPDGNFVFVPSR
jgi:hypothetical protein